MSGGVRLDLVRGIRKFKTHVDAEKVYQAWKTGNYPQIMASIPWDKLPGEIEPAAKRLDKVMDRAAKMSLEGVPPATELRLNMNNPGVRDYVNRRTGELVVNIQGDTQRTIQNAVARSFNEALTPRQVADTIRGSIGLYPQQETALRNYRIDLTKKGLTDEKIDSLSFAYEGRLLDQRAMMIARTETRMAGNIAQQSVWEQASQAGMLPQGSMRVWIVDGNPCVICEAMEGVEVGMYEPWTLPDGRSVMIPTMSHPNCMCGFELKLG